MNKLLLPAYLLVVLFMTDCTKEEENVPDKRQADPLSGLIATGELRGDLMPFPLVENPAYRAVHEADFMQDDELVFISKSCGILLVYPHRSMIVEVVNEARNGVYMAVSYCPITRSGISINRLHGGDTLLLTASGYLFRENLVAFDLHSGRLWSQMQLQGIGTSSQEKELSTFPLVETTWKMVREHFPEAWVYIVDGIRKGSWQVPQITGGLQPGDQSYGIVGRAGVELFGFGMFPGETSLLSTSTQSGGHVVVAGSSLHHFIVAFTTSHKMQAVEGRFPIIMKDQDGTLWNIFGEAVTGLNGGQKLRSPLAYTAADWAWRAHFEHVFQHPTSPSEDAQ